MKDKYVKLIEKDVKKGPTDVYHGFVTSSNKEFVVAICQGPDLEDPIRKCDFALEDWEVEPSSKEEILHYFRGASVNRDKKVLDAEFEVEHQKFMRKKEVAWIKITEAN